MILILPTNERLNMAQVCSYTYKDGRMKFLTSSDRVFEFETSVDNAARLLTKLDNDFLPILHFNPQPPKPARKPTYRPHERPGDNSTTARNMQVDSDGAGG